MQQSREKGQRAPSAFNQTDIAKVESIAHNC